MESRFARVCINFFRQFTYNDDRVCIKKNRSSSILTESHSLRNVALYHLSVFFFNIVRLSLSCNAVICLLRSENIGVFAATGVTIIYSVLFLKMWSYIQGTYSFLPRFSLFCDLFLYGAMDGLEFVSLNPDFSRSGFVSRTAKEASEKKNCRNSLF